MGLIAFLLFMSYMIIGLVFMGIFPDRNDNPSGYVMFLWPLLIAFIVIYILFQIVYCIFHFFVKLVKSLIVKNKK